MPDGEAAATEVPVSPVPPVTYVLTDVVSRAGHRISLTYDASSGGSRLVEIVDSGGRSIHFEHDEHDEHGRIAVLTAPHPGGRVRGQG